MIDLSSDTVTRPTRPMLRAMMAAEVGDDVFGLDPTANALQRKAAEMFGMEDALFCPSGTMCNQIAINVHTQPLDEVICDELSHIYQYETGGYAFHSGVALQLLKGRYGKLNADQVAAAIRPDYDWLPRTRLVVLENTCNKGGGSFYTREEIQPIRDVCLDKGLALHLDGARLFNALVESGESPRDVGAQVDSISLCLSKGLGAPVGSLLIGSRTFIREARRLRKVMGGGMRQVGYLAAAGIYALDNHVERLKEDNARARRLGEALEGMPYVESVRPVRTNIVIFDLKPPLQAESWLGKLREAGIIGLPFGPRTVRFITHLDVDERMVDDVIRACKQMG